MKDKIVQFSGQKRDIRETLDAIKGFLEANDENSIQGIFVRINHGPEEVKEVSCWQSGLGWDDIGMMEVEVRRMMEDYYDQCMGIE